MSAVPQQSERIFAHYLDPKTEGATVRRYVMLAIVSAVLGAVGVVLAVTGLSWRGWLMGGLGLLGVAIFGYLISHQKKLAGLRGEDLLVVALDANGIAGPDSVKVGWSEVTGVVVDEFNGGSSRLVRVHITDYEAALARAVGVQRKYLAKTKAGAGELMIGLGQMPTDTYARLLEMLRSEGNRRGFPLERNGE